MLQRAGKGCGTVWPPVPASGRIDLKAEDPARGKTGRRPERSEVRIWVPVCVTFHKLVGYIYLAKILYQNEITGTAVCRPRYPLGGSGDTAR